MAHGPVNPDREYELLRRRLDDDTSGAPPSPSLDRILRLLFRPDEAALAARIPARLMAVDELARRLAMPEGELASRLDDMARRGLVVDLLVNGRLHVTLAPVVIGFFEFTFMRARPDAPMGELAHLFEDYLAGDGTYARTVFGGETQLGRALPHETSLPAADQVEVCSWDRATSVVDGARIHAVSLCACRHAAEHRGTPCAVSAPLENCLSFDRAADFLVRRGLARPIDGGEALAILEAARAHHLVHTADNVQSGVAYICNCCSCCCGMLTAIRRFDLTKAVQPSSLLPRVDADTCTGCGACEASCPVDAIALDPAANCAVVAEDLCLGCGVCHGVCPSGAIAMVARRCPPVPPPTMYHRMVAQAIERGRLGRLLAAGDVGWTAKALGFVVSALEAAPPTKALLAVHSVRSQFLEAVVASVRRGADVLAPRGGGADDTGGRGS